METARYFQEFFPLEEYFFPGYVFRLHCLGFRLMTVCLLSFLPCWPRVIKPKAN